MAGYKEIARLLHKHFLNGEYPEGKYPSLRKIAADMGCSYVTAVRAMRCLREKEQTHSTQKRPVIAMVSSHWNFSIWHRAIREAALALGGQPRFITYSTEDDPIISETLNEKYDLIFLWCPVRENTPLFNVVLKNKERIVLVCQDMTGYGLRCVEGIPVEIILTIMQDLAGHGIRHIDMLASMTLREAAPRRAVWEKGLRLIKGHGKFYEYPHTGFNEEAAETYDYLKKNFRIKDLPEAFFCTGPHSAQGLYRFLFDYGLVPGKDISVFSFGDQKIAETMTPPLATAIDSDINDVVKTIVAEYITKKFSATMKFQETAKIYFKGSSLVPFNTNITEIQEKKQKGEKQNTAKRNSVKFES